MLFYLKYPFVKLILPLLRALVQQWRRLSWLKVFRSIVSVCYNRLSKARTVMYVLSDFSLTALIENKSF